VAVHAAAAVTVVVAHADDGAAEEEQLLWRRGCGCGAVAMHGRGYG
jgi:hypothetical protein